MNSKTGAFENDRDIQWTNHSSDIGTKQQNSGKCKGKIPDYHMAETVALRPRFWFFFVSTKYFSSLFKHRNYVKTDVMSFYHAKGNLLPKNQQ